MISVATGSVLIDLFCLGVVSNYKPGLGSLTSSIQAVGRPRFTIDESVAIDNRSNVIPAPDTLLGENGSAVLQIVSAPPRIIGGRRSRSSVVATSIAMVGPDNDSATTIPPIPFHFDAEIGFDVERVVSARTELH